MLASLKSSPGKAPLAVESRAGDASRKQLPEGTTSAGDSRLIGFSFTGSFLRKSKETAAPALVFPGGVPGTDTGFPCGAILPGGGGDACSGLDIPAEAGASVGLFSKSRETTAAFVPVSSGSVSGTNAGFPCGNILPGKWDGLGFRVQIQGGLRFGMGVSKSREETAAIVALVFPGGVSGTGAGFSSGKVSPGSGVRVALVYADP